MRTTLSNVVAGTLCLLPLLDLPSSAGEMPLGAAAHLFQLDEATAVRTLDTMCRAGLVLVRTDARWAAVEKRPGEYLFPASWDRAVDHAVSLGMEPMLIIDYGNPLYANARKPTSPAARAAFARYAAALAGHFRGRVRHFEVWNEWDTRTGRTRPGEVADYAALLRETYPAIKAASPEAVVIAGVFSNAAVDGGEASTLSEFAASGVAEQYSDAISIHVYPTLEGQRLPIDSYVERFRESVAIIRARPGLADKPILVTETGASTNDTARGVGEDRQWDYISAGLSEAEELGIGAMILYDFRDSGKGQFGLLRRDWSPKPAFQALAAGRTPCN
ncbi:cellulase family glycosylhydrolase [Amaricoccus solimangrovi]|nr:cellulase family glycosylhydrolase [Amaricoccus solimangrovi]